MATAFRLLASAVPPIAIDPSALAIANVPRAMLLTPEARLSAPVAVLKFAVA